VELAKKNIRKPVVEVGGIIKLVSHEADGMERIKKILTEAKKENKDAIIQYLGAPNYKLSLKAEDYKKGEKALGAINDRIAKLAQKNDCEFAFERAEK
jgi:translation initiation factor 2 subunit 1